MVQGEIQTEVRVGRKILGGIFFFFFNRQLLGFCLQMLCRTAVKHKNQRFWSPQACQSWWSRWRQGGGQHLPHALIEYRNCQRSYEKEGGPWRQQTRAGQSVVGFKAQVERVNGQNLYRVTTRRHGTRQVECSTHIVGLEIRRVQWRHPWQTQESSHRSLLKTCVMHAMACKIIVWSGLWTYILFVGYEIRNSILFSLLLISIFYFLFTWSNINEN